VTDDAATIGTIPAMALELTPAEAELLRELLGNELSELRTEIHRTETYAYKEELKAREALLESIIGRLGDPSG
jgi:hypothetical protein